MDAFFVSVELLDQPELRGRPVVVGGAGARGVVAAASYEARAYGVHSAMPSVQARRLCPEAVVLAGRYERYAEVSRRVMDIFGEFTPHVEPLSLDEAFLDVGGVRRLHGDAATIGRRIRVRVREQEGLTCSVGAAPVKFVAKLASEAAKPTASPTGPVPGRGVVVIDEVLPFLHPLPVGALWGVGPATLAKLERLGVRTVGDLAALPPAALDAIPNGAHLHALAHGVDDREVAVREARSVGHEETYAVDLDTREELEREALRLSDAVASRLRRHDLAGRTVTVKVRFADFRTITRSATGEPLDATAELWATAKRLLAGVDPSPGVRLLGVSVGGLGSDRQLRLGDRGAHEVIDAVRERFGSDAIGPASLARRGMKRRGDQQWGPS